MVARAQSVALCFIETKVNSEGWQGRRVERGRERKRDRDRKRERERERERKHIVNGLPYSGAMIFVI